MRSNEDISEVKFYGEAEYEEFIEEKGKTIIPLFIIDADKKLHIISGYPHEVNKDDRLIFLKNKNYSMDEVSN
jgi:hypothetical protein